MKERFMASCFCIKAKQVVERTLFQANFRRRRQHLEEEKLAFLISQRHIADEVITSKGETLKVCLKEMMRYKVKLHSAWDESYYQRIRRRIQTSCPESMSHRMWEQVPAF
ncbi:hypothetical protein AVEN_145358-1 [Araneus ventricosus]|uniref:Uncharacterized protein n=1 Tax=Araneus ventricosus TaxID=182803 RepID=A0A4Y2VQC5_ARAVE|nr:hypothetical protein AVEN_145358-1 [Araneus ventricosus]